MRTFFSKVIKPLLKPLVVFSLIATLVLSNAGSALALSRGGGRIGGGGFSAPSRPYTSRPSPGGGYYPGGGGGYYPGGGIGFPLVWGPIFFGGGGGLFTILIFISIASFIVRSLRGASADGESGVGYGTPANVSVSKVQVGLLSSARSLQADLDRLAQTADTGSKEGLTQALQETTLALLRHPEYWVYGGAQTAQHRLEAAEIQFNRLALAERSKFSEETLSNVNRQLRQAEAKPSLVSADGGVALVEAQSQPGEYIVVTLLVATLGQIPLPTVNSVDDLRRALSQLGSVSSDRLMALEILWTPQVEGQTLSSDELVAEYADLRLV